MEAQSPPTKIAQVADTKMGLLEALGGGGPSIGLGLGLGLGLVTGPSHAKPGFTFLQLQELDHQALIFKYMVAGLSVPFHLIFPIWKSVTSSNATLNTCNYHHYPSFVSCSDLCSFNHKNSIESSFVGCSNLCFDHKTRMDPEPGRCRRTDGKKWRCSKDVIPNQKYCERHMHRGRQRSRKLVENPNKVTIAATSSNLLSITPVNLQLMPINDTTITNPNSTNSSSSTSNNVSSMLGFSPKSVLQSGSCNKTESSL